MTDQHFAYFYVMCHEGFCCRSGSAATAKVKSVRNVKARPHAGRADICERDHFVVGIIGADGNETYSPPRIRSDRSDLRRFLTQNSVVVLDTRKAAGKCFDFLRRQAKVEAPVTTTT